MTITIELQPEIEESLAAKASLRGVSLSEFAQEILAREAQASGVAPEPQPERTGQSLIDAFAEIRGVLTDEEIDTMFARNRTPSRPVDLS
jgi:hypothetical protein